MVDVARYEPTLLYVMVDIASYEQMLLDVAVEVAELRYEQECLCSHISHEAERLRVWRAVAPSSLGGRIPIELWPTLEAFLFDRERGAIEDPEEDDIMQEADGYIDLEPGAQYRLSARMRFLANTMKMCEDLRVDIHKNRAKMVWFEQRTLEYEATLQLVA